MKASLKVLFGITAVALVLAGTQVAEAQSCVPGKQFGTWGGMNTLGGKVDVSTAGASNADFVGGFWQTNNSANNQGPCPVSAWWTLNTVPQYKIQEFINSTTCPQAGAPCIAGQMTVVLEDYDSGGAPGVGGTAYFLAITVDETPSAPRVFDQGRVINGAANGTLVLQEFPMVVVTSSGRTGMNVDTVQTFSDVEANFHGVEDTSDPYQPIASTTTIVSWDLMRATGGADPGRDRSNWTLVQSIPYTGADSTGNVFSVSCDDTQNDTYLAIGITFEGGANDVPSKLVGKATALECDPNVADPEPTERPKRVPEQNQRKPRNVRGGGR